MVGWHHRLSGQEFEEIPGDSEGQGNLAAVHGVHVTKEARIYNGEKTVSSIVVLGKLDS